MAHSPTEVEDDGVKKEGTSRDYELGWKATYRLMREGMSWSGREANCVFLNLDGEQFSDVSGISGANFKDDARGIALVDWDFDGALDAWVKNRSAPQVRFLRNRLAGSNGYLALRLRGTKTNRDGIGARVEVALKDRGSSRLIRTLHAGDGYLSQSTRWLHFGLGAAKEIERLVVRWSGGETETFEGVVPNGHYQLVEGSGVANPWTPPKRTLALRAQNVEIPPASEKVRIVMAARPPMPPQDYLSLAKEPQRLHPSNDEGRSMLLNLWASTCGPCLIEMKEFTRRQAEFEELGIDVLALSVDLEADHESALSMLERIDWPFEAGFATADLLDTLDVIQRSSLMRRRRLPLPTSFLVTADGEISVIYKGPLEVDQLFEDVGLAQAEGAELRYAASPLEGTWLFTDYEELGVSVRLLRELRDHGLLEGASAVFRTIDLPEDAASRRKYLGIAVDLTQSLEEGGLDAAAAELYGLLTEVEPNGIRWRQSHGETLERLGRDEEAEQVYRATLEIKPNHATTLIRVCVLLIRQAKYEDALPFLERAVAVRKDHWRASYLYGSTLVKLGRDKEAIAPLRQVLKQMPDHAEAKALLEELR